MNKKIIKLWKTMMYNKDLTREEKNYMFVCLHGYLMENDDIDTANFIKNLYDKHYRRTTRHESNDVNV